MIADWGGIDAPPYYNPSQEETAAAMKTFANENACIQGVMALGDNFYSKGINGTCESSRFNDTWAEVYLDSPSLRKPWYVNAGNHDYCGNVSGILFFSFFFILPCLISYLLQLKLRTAP